MTDDRTREMLDFADNYHKTKFDKIVPDYRKPKDTKLNELKNAAKHYAGRKK
jgi:hypothetical protein